MMKIYTSSCLLSGNPGFVPVRALIIMLSGEIGVISADVGPLPPSPTAHACSDICLIIIRGAKMTAGKRVSIN